MQPKWWGPNMTKPEREKFAETTERNLENNSNSFIIISVDI